MSIAAVSGERQGEPQIHRSAIVEDGVQLGAGVEIGPFCHVGANDVVTLGEGVRTAVAYCRGRRPHDTSARARASFPSPRSATNRRI